MRKLYIFGIQRSGTSLLAALLGAHSQINMLNQSTSGDQNRLTGKIYQGNKFCVYHDIRWDTKSSRIRNLLYHKTYFILSRIKKYHALRPSARFTVQDLLKEDCKIIIIHRKYDDNLKSILKRTSMSKKKAEKEIEKGNNIFAKIMKNHNYHFLLYNVLISDTENTLKGICKYLEIEYEPKMLEGIKYQPQNIYNKNEIIKKDS